MIKKRDLEFLYELSVLRMPRTWQRTLGVDVASDLEHTVRVVFLALIIARAEGVKDEEKIIKMALVHDLAETRTGDRDYLTRVYVEADEERAVADSFAETSLDDLRTKYLAEYEKRQTKEAKIVKDADNLDVEIELKELEEKGHLIPKKWRKNRLIVRNKKLYTKTAKRLWDSIQKSDPSSWHLSANKWLKMPKAGK